MYVYAESGERHHLPHRHVYWRDGDAAVALDQLRVLTGDRLPVAARELLRGHLADIRRAWTVLNPRSSIA